MTHSLLKLQLSQSLLFSSSCNSTHPPPKISRILVLLLTARLSKLTYLLLLFLRLRGRTHFHLCCRSSRLFGMIEVVHPHQFNCLRNQQILFVQGHAFLCILLKVCFLFPLTHLHLYFLSEFEPRQQLSLV